MLRLARQRLLGGLNARALRTAAAQQGLLQIVRDFAIIPTRCATGALFPTWCALCRGNRIETKHEQRHEPQPFQAGTRGAVDRTPGQTDAGAGGRLRAALPLGPARLV